MTDIATVVCVPGHVSCASSVLDGPDHDLGDLILPREADDARAGSSSSISCQRAPRSAARRISTSFRGAAVMAAMMRSQVSHRT